MTLVSERPERGFGVADMASLHGELMGWVEQAGVGPIQSPRCRQNTIPHPTHERGEYGGCQVLPRRDLFRRRHGFAWRVRR
jgi:hypothetical protein